MQKKCEKVIFGGVLGSFFRAFWALKINININYALYTSISVVQHFQNNFNKRLRRLRKKTKKTKKYGKLQIVQV